MPAARLRGQFVPALAELFPAARDAQVTEFFVTRERRATFRQAPGSGALRPKAATRGPTGLAQYLAISLSAADEYADVPAARLREQFVPALAELFPAARDARVTEFFVTRERRATFRQTPGSGALRPKAATRRPGLVLAGAWTDTGWPDTMEGAVRSGLAAAVELRKTVLTSTMGVRQ